MIHWPHRSCVPLRPPCSGQAENPDEGGGICAGRKGGADGEKPDHRRRDDGDGRRRDRRRRAQAYGGVLVIARVTTAVATTLRTAGHTFAVESLNRLAPREMDCVEFHFLKEVKKNEQLVAAFSHLSSIISKFQNRNE